jgi:predicted secreted protein
LVTARDVLEAAQNRSPEKLLELARVRELLGAVQIKREKFSAAEQELRESRSVYSLLAEPERREDMNASMRC